MRRSLFSTVVVLLTAVAVVATGGPAGASPGGPASVRDADFTDGRYIVTFVDDPVASYDGYVAGFPATRPQRGERLNPDAPAVRAWAQRLTDRHNAALARVGAAKLYDYTTTNNGFAANLSGEQAAELAAMPEVLAVTKDQMASRRPRTHRSSWGWTLLVASGSNWAERRTLEPASSSACSTQVSGPRARPSPARPVSQCPPPGMGMCVPGEQFRRHACNDKLIGARYYVSGFGMQERLAG